jgi:AcrR family transcriptional regulator
VARPKVIDRDRVAEVALQILDTEGRDALSVDRIASEMGVRGPSLYYYYEDKHAILREVARLVLGDLDLDRTVSDWREWMLGVAMRFYSRVRDHPNAAALLVEYMPPSAVTVGLGRAARRLAEAGVPPATHMLLMEGSQKLVWGFTLQQAIRSQTGTTNEPTSGGPWPELQAARRANRMNDEQLLEASLRAFFVGVVASAADVDGPAARRPARRSNPGGLA